MNRRHVSWAVVAVLCTPFLALAAGDAPATDEVPVTYRATSVQMGGPGPSKTNRIEVTIERWSTVEERRGFFETLQSGGQDALLKAMEPVEVGYVRVNSSLGYRLRTAARKDSEKGRTVRVVTDRPISFAENMRAVRSPDYPFGVIEFTVPPDGSAGEGTLIFAAQVGFDDAGNITVKTLPGTTGPQRLMGVEREKPKKKKKD